MDGQYIIYGADIKKEAYGHSDDRFKNTFIINSSNPETYCNELIKICKENLISFVAPGSETTNRFICQNQDNFKFNGIFPLVNSTRVFEICSNKVLCNNFLRDNSLPNVKTIDIPLGGLLYEFDWFPCVVKPATNSGGSNLVFIAENFDEAKFFVNYLATRHTDACIQEYIGGSDEFTVGVLSSPEGIVISSIALKRDLTSKLSRSLTYGDRVISSGWSQGRIDNFRDICEQAESIALALKSTWALNIQGRIRNGQFVPFEINPRHSGTSYFRAMSGVNEIIIGLSHIQTGKLQSVPPIRPATYHRILAERFVYDNV